MCVCVCVCVCMHVHTCLCVCVCVCIYLHVYVCACVCVCVCVCVTVMSMCVCVCKQNLCSIGKVFIVCKQTWAKPFEHNKHKLHCTIPHWLIATHTATHGFHHLRVLNVHLAVPSALRCSRDVLLFPTPCVTMLTAGVCLCVV